jgi:hypothetical protein
MSVVLAGEDGGIVLLTEPFSGGGGGVSSVTGTAPVVSSGGSTPAISLAASYGDTQNPYASKTANFVLAAPNGSAGVPTFRAIVAADIPAGSGTVADGCIYLNNLTISNNYTIPAARGAHSVGPITYAPGVTVTVSSGSRWVIS